MKPRFEVYKAISPQTCEIFAEHTTVIEPLSLDEALHNAPARLAAVAISQRREARR